ncbi:Uncharacterised protein [Chryseobacterium indoltheticum]|uniref:Uncharacterized protein n=1 Tax=Chryseobacterium indoltheticum TaxID=254 RepID=A0A381FQ23_9FLAO|nr:Uncharacterised protein [Chryseobacterium indoltheticum]
MCFKTRKNFDILYKILGSFFLISLYQFVMELDKPLAVISYIFILCLLLYDMVLFLIAKVRSFKKG